MTIKEVCRLCGEKNREIINLGDSPPANNFVEKEKDLVQAYPLILDYCDNCSGLQLRHCLEKEQLYSNYTYLTPDTNSLTEHYGKIVDFLVSNNYISSKINCLEVGSNNGRFLHYLKPYVNSVLGVDPAKNVAKFASDLGVETIVDFFSKSVVEDVLKKKGDIKFIVARHMFAHNSTPDDIFEGMDDLLHDKGVILIENQYAFDTLQKGAFDQIYHEHMFYYSVKNMENYLKSRQYDLNDILLTDIHGGSIVFISSKENTFPISSKVNSQLEYEQDLLKDDLIFNHFLDIVKEVKLKTLGEIDSDVAQQKKVIAYGAPAKAFTMFSTLELDNRKIAFCVDTSVTKIGKIFPTFNIPVISENDLANKEYDTVLVTAWNYKEDILKRSEDIFKKGTKLIFPLPEFEILYV